MKRFLILVWVVFGPILVAGQTLRSVIDGNVLSQGNKGITATKLRNVLVTVADSVSGKVNRAGDVMGGPISAPSFVKIGGTSGQFLKADGSVDGGEYAPIENPTIRNGLAINAQNIITGHYTKYSLSNTDFDYTNSGLLFNLSHFEGGGISSQNVMLLRGNKLRVGSGLDPVAVLDVTGDGSFSTNVGSPKFTVNGSGYVANGSDVAMGAGSTADIVTYNGSGRILFSTAGSVRATITNAGNFGIGTMAPTAKFEVSGSGGFKYNDGGVGAGKYLRSDAAGVASWNQVGVSEISGFGSGIATFLGSATSANLAAAVTDETGSGALVLANNPTFGTSIMTPVVVGGSGTTSSLVLQTTSAVGTTGANIVFKVGNNGGTTAMTITNTANVGFGITTPTYKVHTKGGSDFSAKFEANASDAGLYIGHNGSVSMISSSFEATAGFSPISIVTGGTERIRINTNGNTGFGTNSPSGAVDITSTTGALIVPRMTAAQRTALTGVNGSIVYQTDGTAGFYFYDAGAWVKK